MSEPLPQFRLYPDPVSDGTLVRTDEACGACGRARGWLAGSVLYTAADTGDSQFCPWCIADGTAVRRFGGTFNELEPGASAEAREELEQRTPKFPTWQDWDWPAHCGDATAYVGQPPADELRERYPDAYAELRGEIPDLVDHVQPDGGIVAYVFRCLHCGTHRARWDAD